MFKKALHNSIQAFGTVHVIEVVNIRTAAVHILTEDRKSGNEIKVREWNSSVEGTLVIGNNEFYVHNYVFFKALKVKFLILERQLLFVSITLIQSLSSLSDC